LKTQILIMIIAILALSFMTVYAELSEERELEFLNRLNELTNNSDSAVLKTSNDIHNHKKCGLNVAIEYFELKDQLSPEAAAKASKVMDRPTTLAHSYDSPGGHFKIHYNTLGGDQVFMATTDINSNDIPDFVDGIAEAADSTWRVEVELLGYTPPPSDGTEGGDDRVDIYIYNIGSSYYGWTEPETAVTNQAATSFIVLDNDYNLHPYNVFTADSLDRRLDAARVTIAHEFFHVIHFGIDFTEWEYQSGLTSQPWWEMTAVWMEDVVFDDVNDYILYQEYFFDYPHIGLRTVALGSLHQYASAIFPMYLADRFDTSIIKDIWDLCADYGEGMQFGLAINDAIENYTLYNTASDTSYYVDDSLILRPYNLRSIMPEFALWNYFTGTRASEAPPGIGYEEAADMEMFADSVLLSLNEYHHQNLSCVISTDGPHRQDTLLDGTDLSYFNQHPPQNLGVEYLELNNIRNSGLDSLTCFNGELEFAYGMVGIPNQGGYDAITYYYDANDLYKSIRHNFVDNQIYNRYIVPLIPATENDVTYSLNYCTVVIFESDTTVTPGSNAISIKPPYPNPKLANGENDVLYFVGDFGEVNSPGKMAMLKVAIFTVAGEKVIELESAEGLYDNGQNPTIEWNLMNKNSTRSNETVVPNGSSIAPGVYMAICEIIFADGTETIIEKYKIAIIK